MSVTHVAYALAAILFALGLKAMGSVAKARKGNFISAVGMLVAVIITLAASGLDYRLIAVGVFIGTAIGYIAAVKVQMTEMPEMVALFNGSGGLASLLVGWAEYANNAGSLSAFASVSIILAILVGGVTFTGSIVAWGKLSGKIPTQPVLFPGQQIINTALLMLAIGASIMIAAPNSLQIGVLSTGDIPLYAVIAISLLLGILSVIPIGGADMPVVISLLNSYSGMAACAAGFAINNSILIVAGALVGASGIILTKIMCKAMNRPLSNVLFGGFGAVTSKKQGQDEKHEAQSLSPQDAYAVLEAAESVVFVPGYGMAVAQAQHAVRELADLLEENGAEVSFAIHPVAGRMPGHMNVLLAEANVSYDKLIEMDEVNSKVDSIDVAVVIGANDVVNPSARDDKDSAIYGMPIIEVDKARNVFVLKRSMASGFAGIENPLFYKENTRMIFGDARKTIESIVEEFKAGSS